MAKRDAPAPPSGRGDGTITDDGCCVEIYAALPPAGEAEIIHAALAPGASVLELGCGTGRIADRLATMNHQVLGVDASAAMLSHLTVAQGVHARIEGLDLGRCFDAVVLASNLVNTHDTAQRAAFLATARRHLVEGGSLLLQRQSPDDRLRSGASWSAGDVDLGLRDVTDHGHGRFSATLVHRLGRMVAEQDFSVQLLDDHAITTALEPALFARPVVLTADHRWLLARAVSRDAAQQGAWRRRVVERT